MISKRGKEHYSVRLEIDGRRTWRRLLTGRKGEAHAAEVEINLALRTGTYAHVGPIAREALLGLYRDRNWVIPPDLGGAAVGPRPEVLTLWRAIEMTLQSPDLAGTAKGEGLRFPLAHVVQFFGRETAMEEITVPRIKEFFAARLKAGAAPSTVNKEKQALSWLWKTLMDNGLAGNNPTRLVRSPSDADRKRELYISWPDFARAMEALPDYARGPIAALYYSGARRGEIVGLTWSEVNLHSRIIRLGAQETKERRPKRLPLRHELVDTLSSLGRVRAIGDDRVFRGPDGIPAHEDSLSRVWRKSCITAGVDPAPSLHGLRHTWKTNAARSGMDVEIREAILGHSQGIRGAYGHFSDTDMLRAIDSMTFDHGPTEVWVKLKQAVR